jgi:hypothetical protein
MRMRMRETRVPQHASAEIGQSHDRQAFNDTHRSLIIWFHRSQTGKLRYSSLVITKRPKPAAHLVSDSSEGRIQFILSPALVGLDWKYHKFTPNPMQYHHIPIYSLFQLSFVGEPPSQRNPANLIPRDWAGNPNFPAALSGRRKWVA